jgi:flagellar biogenesis protein FliO
MDSMCGVSRRLFPARWAWQVAVTCLAAAAFAGPPHVEDDNDEAGLKPAVYSETESAEPPRLLSPRSRPETAAGRARPVSKNAIGQTSLWGTIVGLFIVFALFVAARAWLTRHGPVGLRGLPTEALELLGKRTIEPRVSIQMVRCGGKILVLGVSPEGIRTLSEISDPVEVDLLAGACRRRELEGSAAASFEKLLQRRQPRAGRDVREDAS